MNNSTIPVPREIQKNGTIGVRLLWSDGTRTEISSELLRRNCPCAGCREQRGDGTHAKPLTGKKRALRIVESGAQEELSLQEVWGIGNYAIGLRWADGHDSGIYTFPFLHELSREPGQTSESTTQG